jgi:preprotein translocase subunit YajC
MQGSEFTLLYFLVLVTLVIVMVVIPSRKKHKQKQEMIKAIAPGDTVVTIGGIVAEVVAREETTFVLRLNENSDSLMRVMISAIQGATQKNAKGEKTESQEIVV